MKVLFDTSVLVAALIVSHPKHSVCFPRLKAAESKQIKGVLSTHSLAETYSVMTRLPIQPHIPPSPKSSKDYCRCFTIPGSDSPACQ